MNLVPAGLRAFGQRPDLAIDLGTSSTRLIVRGKGLVDEVPTVVAVQTGPRGREVVAIGEEAKKMLGRTPAGTEVIRPVRGGVVSDFQATEQLLRALLAKLGGFGLIKPKVLVCVPSTHTEIERRAVMDAARAAGAREVVLAPTPMAAALGADLPVGEPVGSMIVDIGGGRTEIAVTSLGGRVIGRSVRVAGEAMDEAIQAWLRDSLSLLVGERTAEQVKLRAGCAEPVDPPLTTSIRGRDLQDGAPRDADIVSTDLAVALAGPVGRIRDAVLAVLQDTPPELAADILDRGVLMCGGGSLLRGLDHILGVATGLAVLQAEDPEHCVARGAARLLEDPATLERVAIV